MTECYNNIEEIGEQEQIEDVMEREEHEMHISKDIAYLQEKTMDDHHRDTRQKKSQGKLPT